MQLECTLDADGQWFGPRFNSILVQLEYGISAPAFIDDCEFQFHIGAIRIRHALLLIQKRICFNSILVQLESKKAPALKRLSTSFNSILVQLESEHRVRDRRIHPGFNSILVQLESSVARLGKTVKDVSIPYWCN